MDEEARVMIDGRLTSIDYWLESTSRGVPLGFFQIIPKLEKSL